MDIDQLSIIAVVVVVVVNFSSSSSKPLGQYQPNLAKIILV